MPQTEERRRLTTGFPELDGILGGGLVAGRPYLLLGAPGSGKTTVGLRFLQEGVNAGETVVFASLEASETDFRGAAESLGLDLSKVFLSLKLDTDFVAQVIQPWPERLFLDPLVELPDFPLSDSHNRGRIVSFVRSLTDRGVTVMVQCDPKEEGLAADLTSVCEARTQCEVAGGKLAFKSVP